LKTKRILFGLSVFTMLLLFTAGVYAEPLKVAIIPFVNTTTETRDFAMEAIQKKFDAKFTNGSYTLIPNTSVAEILAKSGYDPKMMELADKETMINVAKSTGADAVVAMEIVQINNHRSSSLFSTSAKSEVKLRFRTYENATNKYSSYQTVGLGVNKAVLVGVGGMGGAIVEGLEKAIDDGFSKFSF